MRSRQYLNPSAGTTKWPLTCWADNIFELAAEMWESAKSIELTTFSHVEKMSVVQYVSMLLRSFLRGTIFALPMAVSVVSMLTLRFSLWSYVNLSLENATAIAVGTVLSFLIVGGFTQSIAHWGFRFVGQGYYYMARRLTFYFVKLGFGICLICAAVFLLFNLAFLVFPWRMTLVAVLYFLFLSAIWLSVTIMYILRKELIFSGLIVGGIVLVYIFFIILKLSIIISQVIALTMVSVASIVVAYAFFLKAEREKEKGIKPPLPRLSIIVYTSLPFFAYGFLYFAFLFTDRIIAWSTNSLYMPYMFWFRGEYELGLDLALIALIIPMGLVEAIVSEMMIGLESSQKNYQAMHSGRMNRDYVRTYIKRLVYIGLFSIANAAIIYFAFRRAGQSGAFLSITQYDLALNGTTLFVLGWAAAAYGILAAALMNILTLFSLSQPEIAYRLTLIACATNMFVGFLLSRWVNYDWAVIGLFVGSVVFTVWSTKKVLHVLNHLDFYLYSTL